MGGNIPLSVYRIGIVELQYLLPDDCISYVGLNDIIYISKLHISLFSLNAVRNHCFRIDAFHNYIHTYDKDNKLVLTAVFKASYLT